MQVGPTKIDLDLREVTQKEIDDFIEENNLDYMECSAKKGENIDSIFLNIIEKVDAMVIKNEIVLRTYGDFTIKSYPTHEKIKEKCCTIS